MTEKLGLAGKIAHGFIESKLTPLIIAAALLLGVFAVIGTPREEDPQIVVPMADIFVRMPGASVKEVEERVTIPMEKKLWEIPGVEYVYSSSSPGMSMATVRFYVGENLEDALVRLYNKMYSNFDLIPPGASRPLIKPRSINDVPILALTLWGPGYDGGTLRRIAAQLVDQIGDITDVSETQIIGGNRRQVKVRLDPARLAAYHLDPLRVARAIGVSNQQLATGSFTEGNREVLVETGDFLKNAEEVRNLVVGVSAGRPVYLRDVARVSDGPEEPRNYVLLGTGPAAAEKGIHLQVPPGSSYAAVTIAVSKRKGTNAVTIADRVLQKVNDQRGYLIPANLHVTVTRNYGETAQEKSNELLEHLLLATISVTILIALVLGWRSSLVVLIAIPVTLALTLFIYYIYGYTLNRVTLFALIFSIGILVDDAIVVVENITRHAHLPENRGRPAAEFSVEAVAEVGNPTILATWTVIAAILPMAFVGGLMGPYMRPIPVGASMAMIFSLFIAFAISPWASRRILRPAQEHHGAEREDWTTRIYRRLMTPLIRRPWARLFFLVGVVVLLLAAVSLIFAKLVIVKMLPFDNKSEFEVVIDMPEGTPLEDTARVTQAIGAYLARVPEVTDYEMYVGTASPYNFNGLVRHYFLRQQPNLADIQVNLLPKGLRAAQSHDIAKRVRPEIDRIARPFGARVKIAEIPPGPPVLATLVAEVYGPDYPQQIQLARRIRQVFQTTPGVVDVDWSVQAPQPKVRFVVDKEKAALNGISTEQVMQALKIAVEGEAVGLAHIPSAKEDVPIWLRVERPQRSSTSAIDALQLVSPQGRMIPLRELLRVEKTTRAPDIYRKNLKRVVYVTGDVAGREESPIYAILKMKQTISRLKIPEGYEVRQYFTHQPFLTEKLSMKWDGEWQITYEVFRDLGFAFGVALILIYVLIVGWFRSYKTPLVIMAPLPLTLVGILPAHALMGAFFTATSMIGFIALAGIIVRNSILVVDFAELRRKQGMELGDAVIDAGAVRFRPILLTAAAVVVGAFVILFDPIFQGLAISLMAGEVASTLLSQMAVPVLYYLSERRSDARSRAAAAGGEQ